MTLQQDRVSTIKNSETWPQALYKPTDGLHPRHHTLSQRRPNMSFYFEPPPIELQRWQASNPPRWAILNDENCIDDSHYAAMTDSSVSQHGCSRLSLEMHALRAFMQRRAVVSHWIDTCSTTRSQLCHPLDHPNPHPTPRHSLLRKIARSLRLRFKQSKRRARLPHHDNSVTQCKSSTKPRCS